MIRPDFLNSCVRVFRPLRFPGKARLLERFVPGKGERFANIFGSNMRLDLSDHGQRWIYFGTFERAETRLVKAWLRPGMTVVDVGANVGYYTLLAASCVGTAGRVFAVEPSPYAHNLLCEVVARNALAQVVTLQAALGSAAGEGVLYSPPAGNHSPSMVPSDRQRGTMVPVRTLDACLLSWGVDQVDLLKIDVEGFELQVLAGALDSLRAGRICALLCELNDWWLRRAGGSAEELYRFLESSGFSDLCGRPRLGRDSFQTRFFVHRNVRARPALRL